MLQSGHVCDKRPKFLRTRFFFFKYLFIYFFGCIGSSLQHAGSFVAAHGLLIVLHALLSSCGMGVSLVVVRGLQSAWAL